MRSSKNEKGVMVITAPCQPGHIILYRTEDGEFQAFLDHPNNGVHELTLSEDRLPKLEKLFEDAQQRLDKYGTVVNEYDFTF